jgi:hypothetical protein
LRRDLAVDFGIGDGLQSSPASFSQIRRYGVYRESPIIRGGRD